MPDALYAFGRDALVALASHPRFDLFSIRDRFLFSSLACRHLSLHTHTLSVSLSLFVRACIRGVSEVERFPTNIRTYVNAGPIFPRGIFRVFAPDVELFSVENLEPRSLNMGIAEKGTSHAIG